LTWGFGNSTVDVRLEGHGFKFCHPGIGTIQTDTGFPIDYAKQDVLSQVCSETAPLGRYWRKEGNREGRGSGADVEDLGVENVWDRPYSGITIL
jgi:hypothetical protein